MSSASDFWFPGRWLGGVSLAIAPLCMLAGVILRIQFHFFFPQQLAAFADHPSLIAVSYGLFLIGNILLWPAIVALARMIGLRRSGWGVAGGALVMFGLFARTFHGGADHLAFQLVRLHDVESATKTVAGSYGAAHVVSALTPAIVFGWIVLAIGAYLAGALGGFRSIALASMSALMFGVLKGSTLVSIVATSGLSIALVPIGVSLLVEHPRPTARQVMAWTAMTLAMTALFIVAGQAG